MVNRPQDSPPQDQLFRLLVVVASPNTQGIYQIDPIAEAASVVKACSQLLDRSQMEISLLLGAKVTHIPPLELTRPGVRPISGASTAQRIGGLILADPSGKPFHGLHIIAHGTYSEDLGRFFLLLENEQGGLGAREATDLIRIWQPERLRLIFLESCQSACSGGASTVHFDSFRDHVSGFMQLLVEAGVPAVVAMQDNIRVTDAQLFNQGFYSALLQTGRVDTAGNNGRQLLRDAADSPWSIPAVTARLRGGDVWVESPLRKANRLLYANLEQAREDRQWPDFPIDVRMVPSQSPHSATDSSTDGAQTGVREDLRSRVSALVGRPPAEELYWLVGDLGSSKSTVLQTVFLDQCAANFREEQPAVPVLLTLQDCISNSVSLAAAVAGAVSSYFTQRTGYTPDPAHLADQFRRRPFLFLIDGSAEFTQGMLGDALNVLQDFRRSGNSKHRFLVCLDENSFEPDNLRESTAFLLIQPLSPERVVGYLSRLSNDESGKYESAAAGRLLGALRDNALFDLAESPWLLAEMLDGEHRGHEATSRTAIIDQIIKERLRRVSKPPGVPTRAPEALYRLAWEIKSTCVGQPTQDSPAASFSGALTYQTLAEIRGNRDFLLSEFRQALIVQSGLLKGTEDDGVKFTYPCFCAYACAKYIHARTDSEQERILDEITATLGRRSRVDWWSETLVLLAGLENDPEKIRRLLQMILSGSLLNEADQVFVAARCLHEARLAKKDPAFLGDSTIVRSVISSLVHRSHPQSGQSVNARKRAVRHLAPLRDRSAVPHLVSLAVKRVRTGRHGKMEFDFSGIRMAAIKALTYTPDMAMLELAKDPDLRGNTGLHEIVSHWVKLELDGLKTGFLSQDPLEAATAAFALGITKPSGALGLLASRFQAKEPDLDLLWAIADSMVELGDPGLEKIVESSLEVRPLWQFAAYLIGKLGASYCRSGFPSFLWDRVNESEEDPGVRGRSLQALAELGDPASAAKIRDICDQWLETTDDQLRYYALQGLRHAGDKSTLAKLEGLQWKETNTPLFERLREEVYDELYWSLAGGLSSEVMTLY